ncbi:uncharacterized protein LOC143006272 [Genypterus blacodes]|uniref:uncharacterized protein LOC143006272 n=1 Tax=Genypterus blacodes TaxID=154954 RepID=UPI003F76DC9A
MDAIGGPVTRRYLNIPLSPDTSPVSCMSPSDIVLKTGSPNSPEGENIFNFRGTGKRGSSSSNGRGGSRLPSCELSPVCQSDPLTPRQRLLSEPCLAIHNLACLNRAYEQGISPQRQQGGDQTTERAGREDEWREDEEWRGSLAQRRRRGGDEDACPRAPQSSDQETPSTSVHKLPSCWGSHSQLRRNTLPSVTVVPPLLHLPPLVDQSDSLLHVPASKAAGGAFLPHPPSSSSSSRGSGRPLLPPLPHTSSLASLVVPSVFSWSQLRHSVQLEEIRGGWMNY